MEIPESLAALNGKEIRFDEIIDADEMYKSIKKLLNIK